MASSTPRVAGRALRELRVQRMWSQQTLVRELKEAARARGQAVGVNAEMVSRWENGHRTPDACYRTLLADVLGLAPDHWDPDVDRRDFLGVAGGAALGGMVPGDTLVGLLQVLRPVKVDGAALEELRGELETIQGRYASVPPARLLDPVAERLRLVTTLLREPQPLGVRERLLRLGGELAGLRGSVAFHLGDEATAGQWYRVALKMATEADEGLLAGWILGAHSLVPTAKGNHTRALELIEEGLARTSSAPRSPTRGWLLALAARAEAAQGHTDKAREALRRAVTAPGRPVRGEAREPMVFEGEELLLDFYESVSLKLLDDLIPAERGLRTILERFPADTARSKAASVIRLETADLHLRAGRPDEAAHLATVALDRLPTEEAIAPIRSRVGRLRRGLEPWSAATAVRRLDERLTALGR